MILYSMKTWKEFLIEQTNHEYSSTQVNIPMTIATKLQKWGKETISDEDVYDEEGYGREEESHVTVLFGLHANEPNDAQEALKDESPVTLTIKETSMFEAKDYDVLKFTIESEDLVRLNKKISDHCENTQTHPNYNPHCTIAYLKKGKGKEYCGDKTFDGTEITIDKIMFSNKNRIKTSIQLSEGS